MGDGGRGDHRDYGAGAANQSAPTPRSRIRSTRRRFAEYNRINPNGQINYQPLGSVLGDWRRTRQPCSDAGGSFRFTWPPVYENPDDEAQAKVMMEFLKWALTDGQKYATELGYAPLPQALADLELKAPQRIKVQ